MIQTILEECIKILIICEPGERDELIEECKRWCAKKTDIMRSKLAQLKISESEITKSSLELRDGKGKGSYSTFSVVVTVDDLEGIYKSMSNIAVSLDIFHEKVGQTRDNKLYPNVLENHPKANLLLVTAPGPKLPISFIALIFIDAFTDGFLIGLAYAVSPKAGIVIAFANTLEMSLVGISFASRLMNCSGTAAHVRQMITLAPAFIMFIASIIGASVGLYAVSVDVLFATLISFAVVILTALVLNELLVDARKNQGEEESWYISAMVFLGLFLVLIMDRFI